MTWVVDTCIVIDLVERDSEFSATSAAALESQLADSFVITRNEDDFRALYPSLTIFNPTRH